MFKTLSSRFLILTILFVMLAEVLIFVPSLARFRQDYLMARLERAQIASLALLADDMLTAELEAELLRTADVYNVVLRRDEERRLVLSSPIPAPITATYDMRDPSMFDLIRDAFVTLTLREDQVMRVQGNPVEMAGQLIEVTMDSMALQKAMIAFCIRIMILSAIISVFTGVLLLLVVRLFIVRPMQRVVMHMHAYAENPEDVRQTMVPQSRISELRNAEESLASLQSQLTAALRQKDRLAQLGTAMAKISHDLRNILSSTQLFADRMEESEDPTVNRLAPKLVGSVTRAINLCETTLSYGRAEETPPNLALVQLAPLVADVIETEPAENISYETDIPNEMEVSADPDQLFRVLSNLIRNAKQAIEKEGIEKEGQGGQIRIQAQTGEATHDIRIHDTGPGIAAAARADLFTAFKGSATKGGSGLGLAISAELIRGHGGELHLERSDETGSVFHISLPI